MPTLQEDTLLVKLFYSHQENSVAAVKEFRRMKQIRRGSMSPCALRKMIQKFETTGKLGILPSRGRKQIPSSSVEDAVAAVVEASGQSPHGSVPVVSRVLDMPYSTVRKILRRVLNLFPYKIKPVTYCRTETRRFVQLLNLSSLLEWWLTSLSHGIFCGVTKATFASMGTLTPTIVEFG
ncbi:hypothetical protein AVEN_191011-1 [Araneus ventricosus]|uniref:Uncharacterized protein n=1 Tax=Araneus ventricosus TaxID=182803 RepID=A0A4Y2MPD8_ARAVE|nr:hypothetical protein AVEN_191011-1 [Araneus ventricosus]